MLLNPILTQSAIYLLQETLLSLIWFLADDFEQYFLSSIISIRNPVSLGKERGIKFLTTKRIRKREFAIVRAIYIDNGGITEQPYEHILLSYSKIDLLKTVI